MLALLSGVGNARAQRKPILMPPIPRGYVCYRAEPAPVLDGALDDPAWRNAPWTSYFVDIEGDRKPRPRFKTRAKMLWDDTYFYIAAEIEEPHVWATITEHDAVIFQDNDFEVFIDPDGDNHNYYELELNALNTTWDLRLVTPYRNGGPALNEWEIDGMKTAVQVQGTLNDPTDRDNGWSLEIALPWKALGEYANCPAPPREGDQWRVNFSRVEWEITVENGKYRKVPGRPEDNWVWSPQGVVDMHRPERWGYVQFTKAAPGSARFRPDPTLPIRGLLMELYLAQQAFHEKERRWASSLHELDISQPTAKGLLAPPEIQITSEGYQITAQQRGRGRTRRTLHIRQDSRLWQE
jgi:hypothetical protein